MSDISRSTFFIGRQSETRNSGGAASTCGSAIDHYIGPNAINLCSEEANLQAREGTSGAITAGGARILPRFQSACSYDQFQGFGSCGICEPALAQDKQEVVPPTVTAANKTWTIQMQSPALDNYTATICP
jgi:hypothetical protein